MSDGPPDDALLRPCDVAAWLDVEESWLAQAIAREELPVMGFTSTGEPVVLAAEVRAWLRRPDPSWTAPKGGEPFGHDRRARSGDDVVAAHVVAASGRARCRGSHHGPKGANDGDSREDVAEHRREDVRKLMKLRREPHGRFRACLTDDKG